MLTGQSRDGRFSVGCGEKLPAGAAAKHINAFFLSDAQGYMMPDLRATHVPSELMISV